MSLTYKLRSNIDDVPINWNADHNHIIIIIALKSLRHIPNHMIPSVDRVKNIELLNDYLYSVHSPRKYSFQLLNDRSVRNKVDLITQSITDTNYSISATTETWLTNDDSALASQLTPSGFNILLANRSTSHRGGGLALLFLSGLKLILLSIPCLFSCKIMICNIQFLFLFTIVIILIYLPSSPSLWSFLTYISSIEGIP